MYFEIQILKKDTVPVNMNLIRVSLILLQTSSNDLNFAKTKIKSGKSRNLSPIVSEVHIQKLKICINLYVCLSLATN